MGCTSSIDADPLIVDQSDDICWQLQLIIESVPPLLMVLVGASQIISNTRYPKLSCQYLIPKKINGLKFILTCAQLIWPFAVALAHGVDTPEDIPYQLFVVPTLQFAAWSFALYILVLDIRRFVTFPYVLRAFAIAEAIVEAKAVLSQILRRLDTAGNVVPNETTTFYFMVICLQLTSLILLAAIPSLERIDTSDLWWKMVRAYAPVESHEHREELGEPFLAVGPMKRCDAETLIGEGPLSLHVRLHENSEARVGGSCGQVWDIANFTLFVIRVKWDKKSVWEVKRRYHDFVLLVTMLEQSGLTTSQEFQEIVADSSRSCPCVPTSQSHVVLHKQMKGLNQFLHVCTTNAAVKANAAFRSFIAHGQNKLVGEKFNTMLSIYDFDILACVGKGSFGKVFRVRKKDNGNIYALKVLLKKDIKQDSQIRHTKTERQILGDIVHPFVCALRYAFQSETKLYLVLDFFSGGELGIHLEKAGKFSEDQARFYAAELILGLAHLHGQHIVYRDLKPGNILLEADGHIKIADFGLSKKFKRGESRAKTFCGTPMYMAPELIERQPYSFPVDWWALGVIIYEMMTGEPPFIETNMKRLFKLVLTVEVSFPSYMSPAARSLIGGLLKKNPTERLGSGGEREIQEHEFFRGMDWRALFNKGVTVPFVPTPRRDSQGALNVWPELMDEKLDVTTSITTGFSHKQFTLFTYNQPETYDSLPSGSMHLQEVSSFHDRPHHLDSAAGLKTQRIDPTAPPPRRMKIGDFVTASIGP